MAFDESAWVAVGFVIFMAVVWRKAGGVIGEMLDARGVAIREELDQAKALREEAAAQLESYKAQQKEAAKEAKQMSVSALMLLPRLKKISSAVKRRQKPRLKRLRQLW